MEDNRTESGTAFRRTAVQWLGIGLVIGILYLTGLHTTVIASLQRAMLYTGFFDARVTDVADISGPFLRTEDYAFALLASDGTRETLADFREKVTFINVWASWCPPCLAEMPTIQTLHDQLAGHENIRFILLSVDQEQEAAVRFMENNNYSMPYFFPATRIPSPLQSTVLPTSYVVSSEGQVVYKKEGIADYSTQAFREWLIELSESGRKTQ